MLLALACVVVLARAVEFREHVMVSHDTARIGERTHPHNRLKKVVGYAFYHTNHRTLGEHFTPPTSKAVLFGRSNYTHDRDTRKRSASSEAQCGSPISSGTVWKTSRGYHLNTKNRQQLTSRFLVDSIAQAFDAWGCILRGQNRYVIGPLLSVRPDSSGDDINVNDPDGECSVGIGTFVNKRDTIAVTVVWGVFDGPLVEREIVEFKMVFNNHYRFGNSSITRGVIDLPSTATHEAGHACGIEDEYNPACAEATMYGSSVENETKKRTLHAFDIKELRILYPRLN